MVVAVSSLDDAVAEMLPHSGVLLLRRSDTKTDKTSRLLRPISGGGSEPEPEP